MSHDRCPDLIVDEKPQIPYARLTLGAYNTSEMDRVLAAIREFA